MHDEKVATLHLPVLGAALTVLTQKNADSQGLKVQGPIKRRHYQPASVCLLVASGRDSIVDKMFRCTLELQIEPGAEADDDEVRVSAWMTSFAEAEDTRVRASAWMSNTVCGRPAFRHDSLHLPTRVAIQ